MAGIWDSGVSVNTYLWLSMYKIKLIFCVFVCVSSFCRPFCLCFKQIFQSVNFCFVVYFENKIAENKQFSFTYFFFLFLFSKTIQPEQVIWSVCCMIANLGICVLGCWRCFANNYLHWAAACTWLLLNLQGILLLLLLFTLFFFLFCQYIFNFIGCLSI